VTARPPPRGFPIAVIEQGEGHRHPEHAAGLASRQLVRSFHATKQIRGREPRSSSRVGLERCALTELVKRTKLCASGRRSGEQDLERDRRLLRDLRARNSAQRNVMRQHAGDRRARLSECHRRGRRGLVGVAELLFCAQAIESRAFTFPLTGAKDLDEPFHLAHVGSNGLEAFLLGDDASDRRAASERSSHSRRSRSASAAAVAATPARDRASRAPNSSTDCSAWKNSVNPAPSRLYVTDGFGYVRRRVARGA
jgi:hypothetical protein